ncbi:MAG TPA: hypothetical protein VMF08_20755 [Candidatus Sulfotelmatobacter sp.]|nr:hypothetical protein [Candidatus Sulfotelmatobacter sp.]
MNTTKDAPKKVVPIPIVIVLAFCLCGGCVSQRSLQPSDERTWENFVRLVNQLQWSEADQGSAFEKTQKTLGLDSYSAMELDGNVVVTPGNRHKAKPSPMPRVWAGNDEKLVCAGDLYGDGRTEYVLAFGWFGPMGGVICVYDPSLRKIVDQRVDGNVVWLELDDLLHDGKLELICCQDHHHGTDGWLRDVTVYRISKSGTLNEIWKDYIYSEFEAGVVSKQKVRFLQTAGKPEVIETTTSDAPHKTAEYVWNPASGTFERCDRLVD